MGELAGGGGQKSSAIPSASSSSQFTKSNVTLDCAYLPDTLASLYPSRAISPFGRTIDTCWAAHFPLKLQYATVPVTSASTRNAAHIPSLFGSDSSLDGASRGSTRASSRRALSRAQCGLRASLRTSLGETMIPPRRSRTWASLVSSCIAIRCVLFSFFLIGLTSAERPADACRDVGDWHRPRRAVRGRRRPSEPRT